MELKTISIVVFTMSQINIYNIILILLFLIWIISSIKKKLDKSINLQIIRLNNIRRYLDLKRYRERLNNEILSRPNLMVISSKQLESKKTLQKLNDEMLS